MGTIRGDCLPKPDFPDGEHCALHRSAGLRQTTERWSSPLQMIDPLSCAYLRSFRASGLSDHPALEAVSAATTAPSIDGDLCVIPRHFALMMWADPPSKNPPIIGLRIAQGVSGHAIAARTSWREHAG